MGSNPANDVEIRHTDRIISDLKNIFLQDTFSDVTIVVENVRLPAHRVILASRSDYFRALLYSGMRETTQQEVILHETDLASFRILLEYIYTGIVNLSRLKVDVLCGVLGLANQYGFLDLERDMIYHMKSVLNERNVCSLYQVAFGFSMNDLSGTCMKFVDRYARNVLESPEILQVNAQALQQLLQRSSLCAREIDIFNVVRQWAAHNEDPVGLDVLLETVRWELLTDKELVSSVRQSNLLPSDKILDILAAKQSNNSSSGLHCKHRGFLDPGVNVASSAYGATVVRGETGGNLLDNDANNYDLERGYTRHSIEPADKTGCVHVKLGMPCIVNHLRMLLWDKDQRSYSYFVELSYDGTHWTKVVDYSQHLCRSWQELYFPACSIQHIKIVGTYNTANKSFHLVKLEAMWKEAMPELRNGFVVPSENVVSLDKHAAVIEGVSRTRNALINGSLAYDWDNGYCCHQIGSGMGGIVVQLSQPYYLSSLRLLLWDVDDRHYTYVVHTSSNQKEWVPAVDTRDSPRRSWQSHRFAPRLVSFIRLQGLSNTANEVFHVVHLEAPDQNPPGSVEASGDDRGISVDDVDSVVAPEVPVPFVHVPPLAMVVQPSASGSRVVHLEGDEDDRSAARRRSRHGSQPALKSSKGTR